MKKIRCMTLILGIALSIGGCALGQKVNSLDNTKPDMTISISPLNASTMNGGNFEGFGTSLCWWANRIGYSDKLAQLAADLFFGDAGLRLNIMRYNIGGGDDPTHNHITRTDSAIPGWLVWDETTKTYVYDYEADKNQLNVLKRAVEAAGEDAYVEVFSNSPPYFMTESGCSSGALNANDNNLREDSYEAFADYLAHVTGYIQDKLGVKVSSLSPMNEPNTNYWGANSRKQEGCHVDAGESQSKLIEETSKTLKKYNNTNTIIAASDETSPSKQIIAYESYSDEAKAAIGRISTHTYDNKKIFEMGELAYAEGFNLWMSEVDGGNTAGVNAGEMGSALWLAKKIISDINSLSPSAWVLWQIIDNHISEAGYNGNTDTGMVNIEGGFWGTAVCDHDNEEIILTKKYYSFGQFSRYIRPNSTIIHCSGNALAAYDSENSQLVIVAVNSEESDKVCNFDLSQFKKIGKNVKVVRTSGNTENGESWAELEDILPYREGFIANLMANSITTYIMDNVVLGELKIEPVSLENATITGTETWIKNKDLATNVIDGDTTTFFNGIANGYIEVDLKEKTKFNVIGYAPRAGYEGRMVDGKLYGSDDGKVWEELFEITSVPAPRMNYVFLPNTCKYRYIRYDIPTTTGQEGEQTYSCNIAELMLYMEK